MKRVFKSLMMILSYSPIATVAVAAQAKASEIEGEMQSNLNLEAAKAVRPFLLPADVTSTSVQEALDRYSRKTGLQGDDLVKAARDDLNLMSKAGLIQYDEKMIMAMGPSEHT